MRWKPGGAAGHADPVLRLLETGEILFEPGHLPSLDAPGSALEHVVQRFALQIIEDGPLGERFHTGFFPATNG
jgi:hypothetical protein